MKFVHPIAVKEWGRHHHKVKSAVQAVHGSQQGNDHLIDTRLVTGDLLFRHHSRKRAAPGGWLAVSTILPAVR